MPKDYYEILGVSKNAAQDEIKSAYKRLAKQHHPDLNKDSGATEKFKEINEAYAVLSDENKRANYDRFGTAGEQFSGFENSGFSGNFGEDIFSSIFEGFFGENPFGRQGPQRGVDLKYEMEISFEEAVFGCKKNLEFTKLERCSGCRGSGAHSFMECSSCHGSGRIRKTFRTPFGMIQQSGTCSTCRGSGKMAKEECEECKGKGRIKVKKKLIVSVPAGVDNGYTLRMPNEGEAGEAGLPSGSLFIEIFVEPHEIFERQADKIFLTLPLSFAQAALGDEVEVPTLKGKEKLKIPAGTQSHTEFRLKGKGVPHLQSAGAGDQIVKIVVVTPSSLTKRQKELFEELGKEKLKLDKGFLGRFKDILD